MTIVLTQIISTIDVHLPDSFKLKLWFIQHEWIKMFANVVKSGVIYHMSINLIIILVI